MDFSFEVEERRRGKSARFRGNALAISSLYLGTGIGLTLRLLNAIPPTLEELGVNDSHLTDNIFPSNGLVLITGVMGSGKSTLLASIFRRMVEEGGRHIVTYESPIEFDLLALPVKQSPIEQSEVPRHVKSYKEAVKTLARRSCDVVLVGEARDKLTMQGVLQASEMGVSVYTTLHTRTVSETPGRILNMFPLKEREMAKNILFSVLRVIVQQRLYPTVTGKRVAIREYLILDKDILDTLMKTSLTRLPGVIEAFVQEKGVSLVKAMEKEVARGTVDYQTLKALKRERGKG
jgi:defect-in-organelle-trafficking protein DotB